MKAQLNFPNKFVGETLFLLNLEEIKAPNSFIFNYLKINNIRFVSIEQIRDANSTGIIF